MYHSNLPDAGSPPPPDATPLPTPVNTTPGTNSWTFSPQPPIATPHLDPAGRPSIFASVNTPSRFAPPPASPSTPVNIPYRPHYDPGDGPVHIPPPTTFNLASSSSTTEAQRNIGRFEDDPVRATVNRRRLPHVEKDVDDPSQADNPTARPIRPDYTTHTRAQSTTLTTLSRLFAVKAATSPPDDYMYPSPPDHRVRRSITGECMPLSEHLYNRGLLSGRHSDITVNAFGHPYRLHRIILDRAPFFASALSGPWLESNAREMSIDPSDIDSNITQASFELAIKRLYGAGDPDEEDADAVALFATACWLEMPDLVNSSIESMLRLMTPETLSPLIRLVTANYYGRSGDKILASSKAMLCRDGWKMPLSAWDAIPGDVVREIVGGDGFFVDGEWSRWVLAKRILDRRLKRLAIEAGLTDPVFKNKISKAPDAAKLMAVRFDTVYRKNAVPSSGGFPDSTHPWITLYTNHDIEPMLVLLDEGIHYVHLPFEQLQYIRQARDVLGLPIMPDRIISNALWMQMELRQKVLNAQNSQEELGLSQLARHRHDQDLSWGTGLSSVDPNSSGKGKQRAGESLNPAEKSEEDLSSDSWDQNGKPRKFWIPSSDCNIIMGGSPDPIIATSQHLSSRLSATVMPEDVQWASDFAANTADTRPLGAQHRAGSSLGPESNDMSPVAYSHFPPFRFAAEFPNPRVLKERKRVYSQTVFYLGSFWNVYVQRVRRGKNPQLGVYLHRAKEREPAEVMAGTGSLAQAASVDERIGQLEREMLMRQDRRSDARRMMVAQGRAGEAEVEVDGAESSGSADGDIAARASLGRKTSQRADDPATAVPAFSTNAALQEDDDYAEDPELIRLTKAEHVPTLPPYLDGRPTIKAYFKIYSPSRGGRMLSVYESAPDVFNWQQSWGWRSTTLMLDENGGSGQEELLDEEIWRSKKDNKLRFMIVIGSV